VIDASRFFNLGGYDRTWVFVHHSSLRPPSGAYVVPADSRAGEVRSCTCPSVRVFLALAAVMMHIQLLWLPVSASVDSCDTTFPEVLSANVDRCDQAPGQVPGRRGGGSALGRRRSPAVSPGQQSA
jgi:hypothetical protein